MSEAVKQWDTPTLGEIGLPRTPNVDPSKYPKETFELYSVPSFSLDKPEIVAGSVIGSTKQLVEPGDVLLCKIVPHLVRVWCVPDRGAHRQIASGEWMVVRSDPARADKHYLRYALTEPGFRSQFMGTVSGVGGSLMRARPKAVAQITVALPPKIEQRRIVTKLDSLFKRSKSARDELAHIPRLVERYKQAILAAAFRGKMTTEWRSNNPDLSVRPEITRIENERRELFLGSNGDADAYSPPKPTPSVNPFKVPHTWLLLRAEAVCDFITKGTTPPAAAMTGGIGDIPYIKVYNLTFNASLNFEIDPTFISSDTHNNTLQRSKVYPGDVLINIVGPPLGKVSLVPESWPEWNINQAIAVFRSVPSLNRRFLAFWFLSEQVLSWAISRSKATAGQRNLTLQICRDMPIPVCPPDEQDQIVQRIDKAFIAIDRAATEASRATDLIDRLDRATLAKAFRGELLEKHCPSASGKGSRK
jgi:type I restriction enzyme S subunit